MKKVKKSKKQQKTTRKSVFCKDNLVRDTVIILFTMGFSFLLISNNCKLFSKPTGQIFDPQIMKNQEEIIVPEAENPTIDTTDWKFYQTQWYGFELKYPQNWDKPILKSTTNGAKWEYRYQFRKTETDESNPYIGFDVVIYNVKKIKELSSTEEYPALKNEELRSKESCDEITGHLEENRNYPTEEIYISPNDDCYNSAFFYSITRNEYIYNIIPIKVNSEKTDEPDKINKEFPEFVSSVSTFNLIDIKKPKPRINTPRVNAPMPVAAVRVSGRLVCAKKNDHPGYSNKGKGKHLDMECCLDPDEYPNPNCYYSSGKYGKYLK